MTQSTADFFAAFNLLDAESQAALKDLISQDVFKNHFTEVLQGLSFDSDEVYTVMTQDPEDISEEPEPPTFNAFEEFVRYCEVVF